MIGYLIVGTMSVITIAVCDNVISFEDVPELRTAIALIGRAGLTSSWCIGYLLTVELFPTVIR